MFDILFAVSIVGSLVEIFKESNTQKIPAENWDNEELYYRDIVNGVSVEHRMENLKNGKYKLTEKHPEPHKDPMTGKIMIENCGLYQDDLMNYGAVQAMKWAKEGKYNLTTKELEEERKRILDHIDYMCSL